jgi:hypothetical protein
MYGFLEQEHRCIQNNDIEKLYAITSSDHFDTIVFVYGQQKP